MSRFLHLEQIGIPERGAETKYVIPLGMLGNRLHNRSIDDNQVFRCRLHGSALLGIAGVEKKRGALQADPVALPASLPSQLDLMLLAQQPLLYAEKSGNANLFIISIILKFTLVYSTSPLSSGLSSP